MGDIRLIEVGSSFVILWPSWGLNESEINKNLQARTLGGFLETKKHPGFFRVGVPLDHISSGDTNIINNWWRNETELDFTSNSSLETNYIVCKIMNETKPINSFSGPYRDRFSGTLFLESTSVNTYQATAFILDHAEFGLLDSDPQRLR